MMRGVCPRRWRRRALGGPRRARNRGVRAMLLVRVRGAVRASLAAVPARLGASLAGSVSEQTRAQPSPVSPVHGRTRVLGGARGASARRYAFAGAAAVALA